MGWRNEVSIDALLGKTFTEVKGEVGDDEIVFIGDESFKMVHFQDCCENVQVEDICGDLKDLIGSPITLAEEVSNYDGPEPEGFNDSYTWTFYKLGTAKGSVTIRWLGESNGYYSESVDIVKL